LKECFYSSSWVFQRALFINDQSLIVFGGTGNYRPFLIQHNNNFRPSKPEQRDSAIFKNTSTLNFSIFKYLPNWPAVSYKVLQLFGETTVMSASRYTINSLNWSPSYVFKKTTLIWSEVPEWFIRWHCSDRISCYEVPEWFIRLHCSDRISCHMWAMSNKRMFPV
jgi:hypothetical protein